MTPIVPLVQPPAEDIRNAAQIAQGWAESNYASGTTALRDDFVAIVRLLRHAIEGLSEPNLASIQAAATMIREYGGSRIAEGDFQRHARDVAAAILRAQVTGEIPPTWESKLASDEEKARSVWLQDKPPSGEFEI